MDLGFVFKLSLYSLTALVGIILGLAEAEGEDPYGTVKFVIPYLSVPLVICGYLVTERELKNPRQKSVGLSAMWANLLGIAALVATGYEFSGQSKEAKLLAGTHLLLYATWIVMFQQKTVRLYWFSLALGILQLAVASVLTSKGWFGICALGYTFGAVWTLSIFSLWRAEQQFEENERQRRFELSRLTAPTESRQHIHEMLSEVRGAVQHEDGTQWLTVRFVTGVLLTTCSALLVSAGFFAFIPRVWAPNQANADENSPTSSLTKKTASSTRVRLGELGTILESTQRVFEIKLTDTNTRSTIRPSDYAEQLGLAEPLYRTAVLTNYNRGGWDADILANYNAKSFEGRVQSFDIKQTIRLEPDAANILYCLGTPVIVLQNNQPIGEIDESTGIATLTDRKRDDTVFEYEAYTRIPKQHPQEHKLIVSRSVRELYGMMKYLDKTLRMPKGLDRLKALTKEIIDSETALRQKRENRDTPRELTKREIANALNEHLLDPKLYSYTIEQSVKDPTIDPLEDFLFNRKSGHCEYFASALTMMLRAAGISSRMVSGYKGGEPDHRRSGWTEVQQRFAHVWVEAWVDAPDKTVDTGWTTFDPTPADARAESLAAIGAKKASIWNDMQSTFSGLWSENILNMSLDRQEASIYKPMREIGLSIVKFFQQLMTSPRAAWKTFVEMISNRENWFSLGGFLFAFGLVACLAGFVWVLRFVVIKIWRLLATRKRGPTLHQKRIVEFYERFVRLMRKHGLTRDPTQTQREFAETILNSFSSRFTTPLLAEIPARISQVFYDVRFGEKDLSADEVSQIEILLQEFESVLPATSQIDARQRLAT